MVEFISYTVVFLAVYFIIEKFARRWWNIPNKSRSSSKGVNSIHTGILRIGWTAFFIVVVFSESELAGAIIIILLWGFEAFMQWKMNRAEREYMITLLGLVFFIVFITVGYSFDFLI
jgi:hypothetical protein